jgi:predicted kinase
MASLVLMMGVPGSGKTTYAKKFIGENDIYVSRDEIRFSLVTEDEPYFSKEDEVLKTFISKVDEGIVKAKRYVVADATHLNAGSRAKLLKNLHNKPDNVYVLYVAVPLEVALERNAQRSGRALVPETSIRNMFQSLSLPKKEEGIDVVLLLDENYKYTETIVL